MSEQQKAMLERAIIALATLGCPPGIEPCGKPGWKRNGVGMTHVDQVVCADCWRTNLEDPS